MAAYIAWNIPVANRRMLTLTLPEDVGLRDLEFIEKYLDLLRDVLAEDAANSGAQEPAAAVAAAGEDGT